jgi:ankyrin repeat protein
MSVTTALSQETIDQFVGNAHGNLAIVKELLEKFPALISASASWTETAIEAATQTGQVEIISYLLDHGAGMDICTAAILGCLDCVTEFIKEDPNQVNARGAHGIPLLYFPVITANLEIAEYLLQQGADPMPPHLGESLLCMVQSCLIKPKWRVGSSIMVPIRILNMMAKRPWLWHWKRSRQSWWR